MLDIFQSFISSDLHFDYDAIVYDDFQFVYKYFLVWCHKTVSDYINLDISTAQVVFKTSYLYNICLFSAT